MDAPLRTACLMLDHREIHRNIAHHHSFVKSAYLYDKCTRNTTTLTDSPSFGRLYHKTHVRNVMLMHE